MIDPNELKLGNYVQLLSEPNPVILPTGFIKQIGDIDSFKVGVYFIDTPIYKQKENIIDLKKVSAVKIQDDLLIKLGFNKTDWKHTDKSVSRGVFIKDNVCVQRPLSWEKYDEDYYIISVSTPTNREHNYVKTLKYVHDLQNTFFSLTNNSLTFNSVSK